MKTKYSFIDFITGNKWQWTRRLSPCLWVKCKCPGHMWVKFTPKECNEFFGGGAPQFLDMDNWIIEDWRRK